MSSVGGVFLEKEINGEPFHKFSFLSETDNSSSSSSPSSGEEAIDSGGGDSSDLSLQTRFSCPISRYKAEYRFGHRDISTSPHFKHPVLPLFWCDNEKPNFKCHECNLPEFGSGYYWCRRCEEVYHKESDGEIIHFSHGHHHLKLEISRVYDEDKYCQACVLPIYEGNYYSCVDDNCDFILHETCANAPRKIRHPLNALPLTLKVVTNEYDDNRGFFWCSACKRKSNGFVYEEESTATTRFMLDVRCASVSEPFKYEGHDHPLFLALTPDEEEMATCHICCHDHKRTYRKLNCIECDFIICFWPGAVYVSQTLHFRSPVYIGDDILEIVQATTLRKTKNKYIVKFSTKCIKNDSELINLDGEATAILQNLQPSHSE
ncbi:hypothetical protein Bca52824_004652 [Brassica carinata]|uniref:DC1 domain-containing protein n=1 Tax=Brassica carinata TaxID=52824 RepID=A0A8X8BFP2_BRACI|nr:hypothetical protein Bca52824_004652 [Brassica carinata]